MTYEEASENVTKYRDNIIGKPFDHLTVGFVVIANMDKRSEIISRILGDQANKNALISEGILNNSDLNVYVLSSNIGQSGSLIDTLDKYLLSNGNQL